jgi:hypothetical protein
MEEADSCETLIFICHGTRRHVSGDGESPKSHRATIVFSMRILLGIVVRLKIRRIISSCVLVRSCHPSSHFLDFSKVTRDQNALLSHCGFLGSVGAVPEL